MAGTGDNATVWMLKRHRCLGYDPDRRRFIQRQSFHRRSILISHINIFCVLYFNDGRSLVTQLSMILEIPFYSNVLGRQFALLLLDTKFLLRRLVAYRVNRGHNC